MKKEMKESFPFGEFLKTLRGKKKLSLRDVQKATGIPNAYLSQLETGERRKLPTPERLKKLADYYNVSIHELLEKAGYLESNDIEETYEQKIDKAFLYVISNPKFKYGSRLKEECNLDTKRFVIDMYEKMNDEKLLED